MTVSWRPTETQHREVYNQAGEERWLIKLQTNVLNVVDAFQFALLRQFHSKMERWLSTHLSAFHAADAQPFARLEHLNQNK